MILFVTGFVLWIVLLGSAWWIIGRSLDAPIFDDRPEQHGVLWVGVVVSLCFTGLPVQTQAQPADRGLTPSDTVRTVDLSEALRLFQENNLSLQRIQADVRASTSAIRAARTYPNPSLQVTHEPIQRGDASQSETYVNVSQTLEWAGRSSRVEAARRTAEATRLRARSDSARLALDVAIAYLSAAAAEQRLAHLERITRVFRTSDSSMAQRQTAGEASGYAVRRIRLERARYEQRVAAATVEAADTRRRLALHILPDDAIAVSARDLPNGVPPRTSATDALRTALRQRPELRRWRNEVQAQQAAARSARRESWPEPTVTAGYKRQSDGFEGAFLGLSVPIPIFDRNRGTAGVEAARADAARAREQRVRREIQNEVRHALTAFQSAHQQWMMVGNNLLADSDDLLRIARIGYAEGDMSLIELLDAADAYRDAHLRRLQLRRDLWVRYFRLRHAIGLPIEAPTSR